jgi:hypothetical protein
MYQAAAMHWFSRESNPGHTDGNDVLYHYTTDALIVPQPHCSGLQGRLGVVTKHGARNAEEQRGASDCRRRCLQESANIRH